MKSMGSCLFVVLTLAFIGLSPAKLRRNWLSLASAFVGIRSDDHQFTSFFVNSKRNSQRKPDAICFGPFSLRVFIKRDVGSQVFGFCSARLCFAVGSCLKRKVRRAGRWLNVPLRSYTLAIVTFSDSSRNDVSRGVAVASRSGTNHGGRLSGLKVNPPMASRVHSQ